MPRSPAKSGLCVRRLLAQALCALLLFHWPVRSMTAPDATPDAKALTAILLIARDELRDPNFSDAVVLVMNHLGPAPVGLVINRPTEVPVARLFPHLKRLETLPDKVYFGGPVELGSVWFLFRASRPPEHAVQAFGSIYLSADRELLLQLLARDKPMDKLRIFIGHSGWGPGQLEAEIAQGSWRLEHADADTIFQRKSEHRWPAPEHPDNST
jgi:putative transcriptional regulator